MMDTANTPITLTSSGVCQTTIPKNHQLFLNKIPWSFTPIKDCRHNLNYDVEISDPESNNGVIFSVRIITSSTPPVRGKAIRILIETEDLNHYLTEAIRPIFLVAIDETGKSAHWLFLQDYIYRVIQKQNPEWWAEKTIPIEIPTSNEIGLTLDEFHETVLYGLEFMYLKHYHLFYQRFNDAIQNFYHSTEHFQHSLQQEISRHYNILAKDHNCSCSTDSDKSCGCHESSKDIPSKWDREIQNSIEQAQSLKILDPKENRIAYYTISNVLDLYGERASKGIRLTAVGEMAFYDYILHFTKSYDSIGYNAFYHINYLDEHRRYFKAMDELTEIIQEALSLGEVIAVSMLSIRLADMFLFATPYIIRTFSQGPASPLMDFAQNILVTSHDLASLIENPNRLLQ